MTNNFCFKPESRVNWAHGIRKWYWNYPKTSQGGAKESKIWVLRVDFDNDKSSSKNILSNWIFLTIFLSTTKTPESAKKNYQNISILDQISISKEKTRIFLSRFRTHVTYKNFLDCLAVWVKKRRNRKDSCCIIKGKPDIAGPISPNLPEKD